MSDTVKNAIAASLAELTQTQDFPTEPFGYGSDISGDYDVAENVAETDPFTTFALAQAVVRRLDCPRGAMPDDKDYGIDLRSYVNRGVTSDDILSLAGQIRTESLKDDRVANILVTVRPSNTGQVLDIEIAVTPVDPRVGGFTLTLSASSAAVLLEEIRADL